MWACGEFSYNQTFNICSSPFFFAESFTSSTVNPIALPYFNFDVQRNVTVTVGQTAFIHCRVERLGDKDVSTYSLTIRFHSWVTLDNIAFDTHTKLFKVSGKIVSHPSCFLRKCTAEQIIEVSQSIR